MNTYQDKYVIVRADRAGVFFGKQKEKAGNEILLEDARKLHYWEGAAAVEEIAMIGTRKPDNCRFTVTVSSIQITGVLQILPCTEEAIETIQSVSEWKA